MIRTPSYLSSSASRRPTRAEHPVANEFKYGHGLHVWCGSALLLLVRQISVRDAAGVPAAWVDTVADIVDLQRFVKVGSIPRQRCARGRQRCDSISACGVLITGDKCLPDRQHVLGRAKRCSYGHFKNLLSTSERCTGCHSHFCEKAPTSTATSITSRIQMS